MTPPRIPPWRHLARAQAAPLAWALWAVVCAALVMNWHRAALSPADMNPMQVQRLAGLWLVVLAVAAWWSERRHGGSAGWIALGMASATILPADLWPLGAATAVSAALLIRGGTRGSRLSGGLLVALLAAMSLLGAYERIFGRVTAESLSTVFQTSPSEAGHYLAHLVTPGWVINQAVWILSLVLISLRGSSPDGAGRREEVLPLAVVALAALAAAPGLLERALALKQGLAAHAQHLTTVTALADLPLRTAARTDLDVIWVIGESQSRWPWGLYGYPRQTTPQLVARKDDLVVMRDAVAPHSYTVHVLLETVYRRLRSDPGLAGGNVALIDLLRSAGVSVHWHSAQERFGPWATPVAAVAARAQTVEFFGSHLRLRPTLSAATEHPDRLAQEALLARLATAPDRLGPNLLVHHMYAAHDPYCVHVPSDGAISAPGVAGAAAAWFGAAPDLSASLRCYEQAVRFTDDLVAQYIDAAGPRTRPTIVLFVPDHGEAPEDGSGHNADRPSARHLEIPVFAYFNPAARQSYPTHWENLRRNAQAPFLGSWTFELLLDLFGVAAPDVELLAPSPAASPYRPPARIIYPKGRRWNYDALLEATPLDLLSATRKALARQPSDGRSRPPLFAHRVNTVLKGLEAARYFDGVEVDVVLDAASGAFVVNHPPMPMTGLTLDDLLGALSFRPDLRLWLDFKNPQEATAERAVALLEVLDARHAIKGRALLEVPADVPEALVAVYARAGWQTSIYLPEDFSECAAGGGGEENCRQRAGALLAKARGAGAWAISFDDAQRTIVNRHVRPRAEGLRLLSWKLSLRSDNPQLAELTADLNPIDALIVVFPSPFSP